MEIIDTLKNREKLPHVGLFIREIIPHDISVSRASELLDIGRSALSNLLNGKSGLSVEMAYKIEKRFNYSGRSLLRYQADRDYYNYSNVITVKFEELES